jgi:outer membrane protein
MNKLISYFIKQGTLYSLYLCKRKYFYNDTSMRIAPITCFLLFTALLNFTSLQAQVNKPPLKLNVEQAIEKSLKSNKKILQQKTLNRISIAKEEEVKEEHLPNVNFVTGVDVLSDLYQYEQGVFHKPTKYVLPRIKYNYTLSADIPIYVGGRIKYQTKIAGLDVEKGGVKLKMDARMLTMQVVTMYLQVLHLQEQQKLILDKIREDHANIEHVKQLRANQLVTDNEVLRTELQLSNHKMSATTLRNEMDILHEQMKPLLGIEAELVLELDTEGLLTHDISTATAGVAEEMALRSNERLQIYRLDLQQFEWGEKIVQSNILPTVHAGATYGYDYPNFKFFPPEEYLNRSGLIGVKVTLPIGNLYKNKQKKKIASERVHLTTLKIEEEQEEIKAGLFAAERRYAEALNKMEIAEEAVAQAKENNRIVQLKYANQLSLITELIDADNAYLEARSYLISLTIDKQLKYYQLQYILGNI